MGYVPLIKTFVLNPKNSCQAVKASSLNEATNTVSISFELEGNSFDGVDAVESASNILEESVTAAVSSAIAVDASSIRVESVFPANVTLNTYAGI